MNQRALVDLARTLTVRAFTADFQRERASDQERAELLEQPRPVEGALAQDYVAWRRAGLWVAGVLLSLGALLALVDHSSTVGTLADSMAQGQELSDAQRAANIEQAERMFGTGNLALLDGLAWGLLLVKIAVAALTVMAAQRWARVGSSRMFARWAWLAALAVPLVIAAWPWGQLLDFSHLDLGDNGFGTQLAGRGEAMKQQVSLLIGATLMLTVAPKLLALFPGIMRSSLSLKTLLPQAAAPGWLTVVFAPFLVGFLLLVLCFLSQVQGSWTLIAGVTCLVAGPCIYVKRAKDLVRPHTDEEVGLVVHGVRRQALGFHVLGGALLFFYVADLHALSWTTALHLLLEAGGGLLLTMVAISDVTVALLAYSHAQGKTFFSSQLRGHHEARLAELAGAGLTDIEAALTVRPPSGDGNDGADRGGNGSGGGDAGFDPLQTIVSKPGPSQAGPSGGVRS